MHRGLRVDLKYYCQRHFDIEANRVNYCWWCLFIMVSVTAILKLIDIARK